MSELEGDVTVEDDTGDDADNLQQGGVGDDLQEKYKEAAAQMPTEAEIPSMAEVQNRIRKMIKMTTVEGAWSDRYFYTGGGPKTDQELANLVLMFFRLEECHYRILDSAYAVAKLETRKQKIGAVNLGNKSSKDFCVFLIDFMNASKFDIHKIHMCVLASRMKLETLPPDSPLITEFDRLLRLWYDVCSGMFSVKDAPLVNVESHDTPVSGGSASADDGSKVKQEDFSASERKDAPKEKEVQVQMLSDYAFFIKTVNQFDFLKLPECIRCYRLATAYNILAIKINRIFESMLYRRRQIGETLTRDETLVYRSYQSRFSPFIDDNTIYTNKHVTELNRSMMEILHVFSTIFDQRLVEAKFLEQWANDERWHFKSAMMPDFVLGLVRVSLARKALKAGIEKSVHAFKDYQFELPCGQLDAKVKAQKLAHARNFWAEEKK